MNRPLALCLVTLALITATFFGLVRIRDRQQLGLPAVRLISTPLISEDGRIIRTNSVFLPTRVPGYETKTKTITDQEIAFLPPDTSFGRLLYRSENQALLAQASVVLMGRDRTSIHQPDFCLTGAGWDIQRKRYEVIRLNDGQALSVRRFDALINHTQPGGRPTRTAGVYVFWFAADGQTTASPVRRTLWLMRDLLTKGVLQRWAYTSFFATCEPGQEDVTYEQLAKLISATVPQIQRFEAAVR